MDKIDLYKDWNSQLISDKVITGLYRNEKERVNHPELSEIINKLTSNELRIFIESITSCIWLTIHDS